MKILSNLKLLLKFKYPIFPILIISIFVSAIDLFIVVFIAEALLDLMTDNFTPKISKFFINDYFEPITLSLIFAAIRVLYQLIFLSWCSSQNKKMLVLIMKLITELLWYKKDLNLYETNKILKLYNIDYNYIIPGLVFPIIIIFTECSFLIVAGCSIFFLIENLTISAGFFIISLLLIFFLLIPYKGKNNKAIKSVLEQERLRLSNFIFSNHLSISTFISHKNLSKKIYSHDIKLFNLIVNHEFLKAMFRPMVEFIALVLICVGFLIDPYSTGILGVIIIRMLPSIVKIYQARRGQKHYRGTGFDLEWLIERHNAMEYKDNKTLIFKEKVKKFVNLLIKKKIVFKSKKLNIIVGKSGSGKTSLLKEIIAKGNRTSILFPANLKKRDFVYIDQRYNTSALLVREMCEFFDVLESLKFKKMLDTFDIQHDIFMKKPLDKISGGELQRIMISMALASPNNIIILDEPTSALDNKLGKKVFASLRKVSTNKLLIIVTHDKSLIESEDNLINIDDNMLEKI